MTETTEPIEPRRSGRWIVPIIALLFMGPLVAAWLLYTGPLEWRPEGRTHAGQLIDPARPLPPVSLSTIEGEATSPDFLKGKWTMAYVGHGDCDDRCRQALIDMRQVRLALGKDMDRVQRLFLFSETCCDRAFVETEHPGLIAAWADEINGRQLLGAFPVYDRPIEEAGRIYLIDPLANLMMSYSAEVPASEILADIERLLRLSNVG